MTKKTWIIFAVICVAIVGGLIALSKNDQVDVSSIDVNAIQPALAKNGHIADHVYGNAKSKVVIIEYADYECPGCASAAPVLRAVSQKYETKIAFVFRNYPLSSLHPNALAAATAAEAAAKQGKFWEMHDLLYANQSEWESLSSSERTNYFVTEAKTLGADSTKFLSSVNDDANIQKKISFDQALGKKINITGTPTIYVNGKNYSDTRYSGSAITTDTSADYVWSSATAFEDLVIKPLMKKNGISY